MFKRLKVTLLAILLALVLCLPAHAVKIRGFTGLTGGNIANLDGKTTASISDGDIALGLTGTSLIFYHYSSSEAGVESSPTIIIPDDNVSGTGAWVLASNTAVDYTAPKVSGTAGQSGVYEGNSTDTFITGIEGAANRSADLWEKAPDDDPVDGQIKLYGTPDGSDASQTSWAYPGTVNTIGTFTVPITTDPYTLTAENSYNAVLFYGATGEADIPAGVDGMAIIVYNTGAFTITIDPNGSEVIVRDGTAQAGGVSFTLSSGAGNFVALSFNGTQWVTFGFKGTLGAGS